MKRSIRIGSVSAALLTAVSSPALAAAGVIEEVVVTATKREQSVQDVPIAISAYSGEQLASRGIQDLRDLQQVSPSLAIYDSNSTSNGGTLRIRGVGTTGNNVGLESSVGTYVDGVYRPRAGQALTDLLDVQRIEVLRGPQGTLFGKNTSAGALHLISNEPEFTHGGSFEVGAGDLDEASVGAAVTGPLLDDRLAYRLAANYRRRDGYYEDLDSSEEFGERDRWAVKGQLLFSPTQTLEARLIVDYAERDESCCAATFESVGSTGAIIRALGGDTVLGSNGDDIRVGTNFDPFEEVEEGGVSLEVQWDLAPTLTAVSITSYRDFEVDRGQDVDFTNADVFERSDIHEDFETFSQELRLQGTYGPLDFLVGGYVYTEDIVNRGPIISASTRGAEFFDLLFSGAGVTQPGDIVNSGVIAVGDGLAADFDQDTDGWALFTHNTWHATDILDVTLGVRYSEEDKDGTGTINGTGGPGQVAEDWPCASVPVAVFCGNAGFDTSTDEEEFTGSISASLALTEGFSVYASYSRGYKAGGINLDPTANRLDPATGLLVDNSAFDPEFANAWEIGVKTALLDGSLTWNSAAFYTDYQDFQLNTFNGAFFTIDNVNEVISQGVETEFSWIPLDGVTVTGGVTYADSRYGDDADPIVNDSAPSGFTDIAEERITHAPYWQGSAAVLVDRPLPGTGLRWLANVNYAYRGDHNTGSDLDPQKHQGGYGLWNSQLGVRTGNGAYEAVLWGRNLGDKRYDTVILDSVSQTGSYSTFVGEPRTFGLTLRANF